MAAKTWLDEIEEIEAQGYSSDVGEVVFASKNCEDQVELYSTEIGRIFCGI